MVEMGAVKVPANYHRTGPKPPPIAMKHGIRNIPTLMLFKGGEAVATHVGTLNRVQLDAFIAKAD